MPKNLIIAFVVVLIVIPVIFLVARTVIKSPLSETPSTTNTVPGTIPYNSSATPSASPGTYNPTEDQNYVLANVLKEKKSEQETKDFQVALSNAAVPSSNLDVSGCKGKPLLTRIEINQQLTVKNADSTPHTLKISNREYTVKGGSSLAVNISELGEDNKVYPYYCDQSSVVGIIWVSK